MEYLNAAADIAETRGVKTAEVDYGYAISYQSMGNHTREADLYRKALGYYEKAFATITATGETELYDRIISNYLVLLYSMGEPMQNSAPHLEVYMKVPLEGNLDISRKYNLELCRGLTELQAGRHIEAVRHFREMRKSILPDQHKQLYMAILNESTAYQQAGMTTKALEALSYADSISSTVDDEEMLASLYFTKCQLYKLLGDTANSQYYFIQYCQVRDSLLSYNQITGLRKAEFSRSLTRQGHQLKKLEYKGNVQMVIIIASAIIMLTLVAFALIIRRKNKVLSQSNRALYEQNREVMAAEKREREERRRYAALVDELTPNQEKYSTRKLADETKAEIYAAIMDVMENNDELYNSDFSLSRLSEICNSRQEYVSQVINETFGCNFNELINKYRIREACRRIEDKIHYGQFTLAAIASGVGIDSATTFNKYFKKVTGMTPSQFKKNSDEVHSTD